MGEVPECPKCGYEYIADGGKYYDENGFDKECDECNTVFFVQPYIKVTWDTYFKDEIKN